MGDDARGGVWHTGQLIATILTLACLVDLWGGRRAWLIGLLAGAAFLTRAPLAFAIPSKALWLWPVGVRMGVRAIPWRSWVWLGVGVLPSIAFFFAYNVVRFGTPLESGYALATLPEWLESQRAMGLFALGHIPMNLDYAFIHLPRLIRTRRLPARRAGDVIAGHEFGLTLRGVRADWRDRRMPWCSWARSSRSHPDAAVFTGWLAGSSTAIGISSTRFRRARPVRGSRRPTVDGSPSAGRR